MNEYPKAKATVYYTDGEPPMVIHFNEPKVSTWNMLPNSVDVLYDSPALQAHDYAATSIKDGAKIQFKDDVTMYVPTDRIKHIFVEVEQVYS